MSSGYARGLPKDAPAPMHRQALRDIAGGATYVHPGYQSSAASSTGDVPFEALHPKLAELTPQQQRIMKLICAGKPNKQIAYELSIAETTVKAHVTAIMRKLGVHSRTQAVLVAQQAKFSSFLPDSD